MLQLLQQYAAYNIGATNTLVEQIKKLSLEQINKEIASSFPSLYKTVAHMWLAEEAWWKRLQQEDPIVLVSATFAKSFNELANQFAQQSLQWKNWVDAANDAALNDSFTYSRNGETITMKVHDMLLHIFNHATYHRGQLVTMLRQLGHNKIPQTDFSAWCRVFN